MIDFETLVLPRSPNAWLMAPAGLCPRAQPHQLSPLFGASAVATQAAVLAAMAAEPRTVLTEEDGAAGRFAFVARSRLMGFQDDVDIRILAQGADAYTFAFYSRSRVGYSDMGVNAARGQRILAFVSARLTPPV